MIPTMRRARLLGPLCLWLYPRVSWRLKALLRWLLYRREGGSMFSITLRQIFARHHGVEVGEFTHGGWLSVFHVDEGTTIGRYCSIAETARLVTQNHPLTTRSTSGMFFHPAFGAVDRDLSSRTRLVVGNDVWISNFAVVLPSVRVIGDGAVIGAGAVVGRDVPPYAIVHGNPARVIGYRFDEARIQELLAERWWDRPLAELLREPQRFTVPLVPPSAPT